MLLRTPTRVRLGLACLAALAASPFAFWTFLARAQPQQTPATRGLKLSELVGLTHVAFGGYGAPKETEPEPEPAPTIVQLNTPITARAARTWEKLNAVVPMRYENETPIEDVLKDVRKATKGEDGKGLQFYVNPVGLQEAEKTMTSPVSLDLDDVPLSTSLSLLLKQLGLVYHVQQDGIVVVTSDSDEGTLTDPSAHILEEVRALRREVAHLREEILGRQPRSPRPPTAR